MGCFWVFKCVCVNSRVRISFYISLTRGSEGKGGHAEYLCVLHGRMYEQHVCVTTAACVRHTVGETSCRAWQHSRTQRTLLTPLRLCVSANVCVCMCVCVCVCVCMCVRTCVCWQDLLFVSPSCHRLVTPGQAGNFKRDGEPTKCSVSCSSPVSL